MDMFIVLRACLNQGLRFVFDSDGRIWAIRFSLFRTHAILLRETIKDLFPTFLFHIFVTFRIFIMNNLLTCLSLMSYNLSYFSDRQYLPDKLFWLIKKSINSHIGEHEYRKIANMTKKNIPKKNTSLNDI